MNIRKLPLKNIFMQKKRTIGLIIILIVLTVSLFGGSLFIKSLNNGLDSLNSRLGSDIIVLPKDAESEVQKIHDRYIKKVDELLAAKEKEIMTV